MKVARRMRCAAGYAQWTHVYGYRCENREWIVEENEAEVIRRIFREYVSGKPITAICSELEADGIVTRKQYEEIPPRVEYSLTEHGRELWPILHRLAHWAKGEAPDEEEDELPEEAWL